MLESGGVSGAQRLCNNRGDGQLILNVTMSLITEYREDILCSGEREKVWWTGRP